MATHNHNFVFDSLTELKDAGDVTSSAAATVDSVAKILDLGSSFVSGSVVIDATAIEVATGNEKYEIEWQLSPDADFGTAGNVICAAVLKLGDSSVNGPGADSAAARYVLRVSNEHGETVYRYARLFTRVGGTIDTTGINFSAFLSPD
jgi:hypothetical protein